MTEEKRQCVKCGNMIEGKDGMPCVEIPCPKCGDKPKKE